MTTHYKTLYFLPDCNYHEPTGKHRGRELRHPGEDTGSREVARDAPACPYRAGAKYPLRLVMRMPAERVRISTARHFPSRTGFVDV